MSDYYLLLAADQSANTRINSIIYRLLYVCMCVRYLVKNTIEKYMWHIS